MHKTLLNQLKQNFSCPITRVKRFQFGGGLNLNTFTPVELQQGWRPPMLAPDIVSTGFLMDNLNEQFSDILKCKPLDQILKEVAQPEQEDPVASDDQLFFDSLFTSIDKYSGIPYVFGGKNSKGIDCSGFTKKVMEDLGVSLADGTVNQWNQVEHIDTQDLQVGDLVFLKGTIKGRKDTLPSHVAIVTDTTDLANGKITVAEASGKGKVSQNGRIWDLTKGFHNQHWLGAGRIRNK